MGKRSVARKKEMKNTKKEFRRVEELSGRYRV